MGEVFTQFFGKRGVVNVFFFLVLVFFSENSRYPVMFNYVGEAPKILSLICRQRF